MLLKKYYYENMEKIDDPEYKKKLKRKINLSITTPFFNHLLIFNSVFRFGDWINALPPDFQYRVLAGSIFVSITYLVYYGELFFVIYRYYKKEDRKILLVKIILMAILIVASHLMSFYFKSVYNHL